MEDLTLDELSKISMGELQADNAQSRFKRCLDEVTKLTVARLGTSGQYYLVECGCDVGLNGTPYHTIEGVYAGDYDHVKLAYDRIKSRFPNATLPPTEEFMPIEYHVWDWKCIVDYLTHGKVSARINSIDTSDSQFHRHFTRHDLETALERIQKDYNVSL